jgi:hypothetical protein
VAHYNTVLHQLLSLIPRHHFDSRVRLLKGDHYVKKFSTWNQLTVLLYAFAGGKTSLRDIENSLSSQASHLYHLGLPDSIPRSTLADANAKRDYRIFEDLFYRLEERCHAMAPKHKFAFKNPLISIDSTVIELSVSLFPWTRFARMRGGLKLHYGYDHSGDFPTFLAVKTPKSADNKTARRLFPIIPDSINCFDRGYMDLRWYRRIHDEKAFFVTRAKKHQVGRIVERRPVARGQSVLFDHVIELVGQRSPQKFPYPLRFVGYRDPETGRAFRFMTNNLELSAQTIADIYKARWQIEAFFKWIKQNLKIKTFLGTSRNAVLTQIWIAMCYYLLLAYIKFQSRYANSLFYLHRVIRATILEKFSLVDLLRLRERRLGRIRGPDPQLALAF